jgi:hypothetical protein
VNTVGGSTEDDDDAFDDDAFDDAKQEL